MSIPRYEDLYGSEYVSPEDYPEGHSVTLKILRHEVIELTCVKAGRAVKNMKCVLTCEGSKKKVAVNKTSAKRLAMAWGKEFKSWEGHYITVEGGQVNGRPATLLTPTQGPDRTANTPPSEKIAAPPKLSAEKVADLREVLDSPDRTLSYLIEHGYLQSGQTFEDLPEKWANKIISGPGKLNEAVLTGAPLK